MTYDFNGQRMNQQQYDAAVRSAMSPYTYQGPATTPKTTVGTTPGASPTGYSPATGGVPQVPSLPNIYGQATQLNQSMLPQLTSLGGQISGAAQGQLLNNVRMGIPGWDAQQEQSMKNIGALSRGEIPLDVRGQLAQQAAERGVATGSYDSPNANAALLRAMGLTSLGLQGDAEKQMTALQGRYPLAQPFDVSKLMANPSDLYESQLLANIYAAAPQPKAARQQLLNDMYAGYGEGNRATGGYAPIVNLPGGEKYQPIARSDYQPAPVFGTANDAVRGAFTPNVYAPPTNPAENRMSVDEYFRELYGPWGSKQGDIPDEDYRNFLVGEDYTDQGSDYT